VLEILEYFDHDRRAATVMEISRALSYPQSSTSELMRCLARLGYLYFNRSRRTYSPTARVSLLGSWVSPTLFRGGLAVQLVDRIAACTGETVVLSVGAVDYHIHHTHVVPGSNPRAITVQTGSREPLLQCSQGELLLASYPDQEIQSAIRRMNADAQISNARVNVAEEIKRLALLRQRGWNIGVSTCRQGFGAVSMLLPRRKGTDRLVVSVVAAAEVVERTGKQIVSVMIDARNQLITAEAPTSANVSELQPRKYG
jgi:DNA-binding IclR family transcriptional regulator